ncbi:MAG: acetyl-CoA carboxylase biotin carboxyl carrier protein subunit [Candidatus Methylomirabilales bacterium]
MSAARLILRAGESSWQVELPAPGRVTVAGQPESLSLEPVAPGAYRISNGLRAWQVWVAGSGERREVFLDGEVYRLEVARDGERAPRRSAEPEAAVAPMPATIAEILVPVGQAVKRGETLLKLEAMKMELLVRAPRNGVVQAIHCREGDIVRPGVPLVDISAESP